MGSPGWQVDRESAVGVEAFSRIAPAVAIVADVITSTNIFDVLTSSTGGRLVFSVYDKYLMALDRLFLFIHTVLRSGGTQIFFFHIIGQKNFNY